MIIKGIQVSETKWQNVSVISTDQVFHTSTNLD